MLFERHHSNQQTFRDLLSSGLLRNVDSYLVTDVSGQPIGPIFKNQVVLDVLLELLLYVIRRIYNI
jgi:hypothetical protein